MVTERGVGSADGVLCVDCLLCAWREVRSSNWRDLITTVGKEKKW
jgi:hypothetical protein